MEDKFSRRKFFKFSGVLAGGVLASSTLIQNLQADEKPSGGHKHGAKTDDKSYIKQPRGRMFFQNDLDFNNLKAATERIYPKDKNGPGAIELGVPYFIDNQLAGAYGLNAKEYMQGPFKKGVAENGYQTAMLRQDLFLMGIKAFETESLKKYKKSFNELNGTEQDNILKSFENNKVTLPGVSSKEFFVLFRDLTVAGALSDPIYQGNDNKRGWSMMEYPGAQMAYAGYISGGYQKLEPLSLADMQ